MSEEMGCTVIFGGKVKRSDVDRLIEQLLEGGEDFFEIAKLKRPYTTCGSTNYGQAHELTGLLEELGLPYCRTSDAKYEYDGEGEYWDGKTVDEDGAAVTVPFACRQDGSPYLVLGDLTAIRDAGGDLSAAITKLEAASAKLPPLEIVEG